MKLPCLNQSKPQPFIPSWFRPVAKTAAAVALVGAIAQPALADPLVRDDDNVAFFEELSVFCFRLTSITAVEGDPEWDAFQLQFEVLNWTDSYATDLEIALTEASDVGFFGAGVNRDPVDIPGNFNASNNWNVTEQTNSRVQWDVGISEFIQPAGNIQIGGTRLPGFIEIAPGEFIQPAGNIQIGGTRLPGFIEIAPGEFIQPAGNIQIGGTRLPGFFEIAPGEFIQPAGNIQIGGTRLPGFVDIFTLGDAFNSIENGAFPPIAPPPAATYGWIPNIDLIGGERPNFINLNDPETIDDGENVLDGFTITVDDWDVNEILSFNWFLTDDGEPIGTADGNGNDFGFGIANITRAELGGSLPSPVFPELGNTGFQKTLIEFAPGANTIIDHEGQLSTFYAEFGGGVTTAFANPEDCKAIFTDNDCIVTSVPEPSSVVAYLLTAFSIFGLGWRRRKPFIKNS